MLKRDITYENYDGETVTETFHFNLSESEIITLEVEYDDGLEATLKRIVETEDRKQLVAEFKKLVLLTYGVRDGNRFIKSDALREEFAQTAAYDVLFMELAFDAEAASNFMIGIMPRKMSREVEKEMSSTPETPTASFSPPEISTDKE